MTQPTPADTLRAAAENLRHLAAAATPGICPEWTYNAVRSAVTKLAPDCSHDEHQDCPPEWDPYHDAPYIALMHPGVGAALAQWLDYHAGMSDRLARLFDEPPLTPDDHPALAVARAILGDAR